MRIIMKTAIAGVHAETGAAITAVAGEALELPESQAQELLDGGYAVRDESTPAQPAQPATPAAADEGGQAAADANQEAADGAADDLPARKARGRKR